MSILTGARAKLTQERFDYSENTPWYDKPPLPKRKKTGLGRAFRVASSIVGAIVPAFGVVLGGGEAKAAREEIRRQDTKFAAQVAAEKPVTTRSDDMSLWGQAFGAALKVGTEAYGARQARRSQPGLGMVGAAGPVMGGLARIGSAFGAGSVIRGAGTYAGKAVGWCRRNPGRCAALGGLTAIEALLSSGGSLPRSGRSRGITSRELRSFRRVTKIISKYCSPVRKAMRSPALKKGR